MKLFKKATSIFVATALAATNGILVSADTQTVTYDSTINDSASSYSSVAVEAERAELYTVTLPKSVTLGVENTSAEYNYEVSVTGEIGEGNYVRVIPLANATLTNQKSGSELPLKVEQEKRRFAYDEINLTTAATADGTYSAENMQPGEYVGNVRYLITLDDGATWTSASCTVPSTRIGQDLNDNGVIDLGEDLDGDGNLDVDEDIDNDGVLDVDEDTNADGILDTGEDIDGDGKLDTAEDTDGDGHLDVDEDTNGDGVLAISEKDSDLGLNVTRGTALGHLYPENRSFECICERCSSVCFAIATPEHLIEFANAVDGGKSFTGATVYLCNDIDLKGYSIPIIGKDYSGQSVAAGFEGIFDGKGYKLYNYKLEKSASAIETEQYFGLFGYCTAKAINNLTFVNPVLHVSLVDGCKGISTGIVCGTTYGYTNATSFSNVHIYNGSVLVDGATTVQYTSLRISMFATLPTDRVAFTTKNCSVTGSIVNSVIDVYNSDIAGFNAYTTQFAYPVFKNCFAAVSITDMNSDAYGAIIPCGRTSGGYNYETGGTFTNVIWDNALCPQSLRGTGMTTDQMKSQSALDVLNTDNEFTWKLDMEGLNNGYPIIA